MRLRTLAIAVLLAIAAIAGAALPAAAQSSPSPGVTGSPTPSAAASPATGPEASPVAENPTLVGGWPKYMALVLGAVGVLILLMTLLGWAIQAPGFRRTDEGAQ